MMNLEKLGITKGHTVTAALISAATDAGLPEAAINELWLRRTLNKQAMAAINAATTPNKTPKPSKQKNTESEDA